MLSSFTIENFKSFREAATLEFAPLTVLIGANASGKSNALEALRLLSWVAQGHSRLDSMRYALRENQHAIRGAVQDLGRSRGRAFSLSCRTDHPEWNEYSVALRCKRDDELRISKETLTGSDQRVPLFEIADSNPQAGVVWAAYNNFLRGGKKPQIECIDREPILTQLQSPARFYSGHKKTRKVVPQVAKQYRNWLSNIFFLDPRPTAMRMRYGYKADRTLTESGDNLSGVLYHLCRTTGIQDKVLKFIESFPEQDIRDIRFTETPRGEAIFTLIESFGNKRTQCDAALLSDGTLRVLAVAAGALSVPEGSILVVEEIDNGVHPSRAKDLLDRLAAITGERGIRILVTSHNPALLDALPNEAMPDVVFCYRDPQTGASRLTRLGDLENYPELIVRARPGQLMTRGLIDRFAKQQLTPEQRKRRADKWLAELREQVG